MSDKPKIGDRVWLRVPHNGTVEHVYGNGDIRVELDEIAPETLAERFGVDEYEII